MHLNLLDPLRDGLLLMGYIWADQASRLARMRAALQIADQHPPVVDKGDVEDWLVAQQAKPSVPRRVYHTVAAQYFPARIRAQVEAALQAAGRLARLTQPFASVLMEVDGMAGAALSLRLWAEGIMRTWDLGRSDAHARWINWHPKEVT